MPTITRIASCRLCLSTCPHSSGGQDKTLDIFRGISRHYMLLIASAVAAGLKVMKRILAAATLTLLLAAFTAEALTPTPIDAQPYGPVSKCLPGGKLYSLLQCLVLHFHSGFAGSKCPCKIFSYYLKQVFRPCAFPRDCCPGASNCCHVQSCPGCR